MSKCFFLCQCGVLIEITAIEFLTDALLSFMINKKQILGPSILNIYQALFVVTFTDNPFPTSTRTVSWRQHNVCITFRPELDHVSRNCRLWRRGVRLYSAINFHPGNKYDRHSNKCILTNHVFKIKQ